MKLIFLITQHPKRISRKKLVGCQNRHNWLHFYFILFYFKAFDEIKKMVLFFFILFISYIFLFRLMILKDYNYEKAVYYSYYCQSICIEISIKDFSIKFLFPASPFPKCKIELATKGKRIDKR